MCNNVLSTKSQPFSLPQIHKIVFYLGGLPSYTLKYFYLFTWGLFFQIGWVSLHSLGCLGIHYVELMNSQTPTFFWFPSCGTKVMPMLPLLHIAIEPTLLKQGISVALAMEKTFFLS